MDTVVASNSWASIVGDAGPGLSLGTDSRDHSNGACDYDVWIKRSIFNDYNRVAYWKSEIAWF
ncbi:hypothetical protein LINPERHAP2_LOCUS20729, partial [Linum perenne]